MAHMAQNYEERQEFWKPVVSPRHEQEQVAAVAEQTCKSCGTDYVMGSRFCHVCGADRQVNLSDSTVTGIRAWMDFAGLRDALGQTTASLVSLILGSACVIAAAVTGFLFTATTLLDWQAVQLWRIEWLLAAVAFFVAGLLLRKK
ncbi:MAG TPA: hypothetical protein VLT16_00225 [Candidatus Limnocylindrales bacterium]|nr:hypothetical protein [Candidatus Limnocylindrales bacterium]